MDTFDYIRRGLLSERSSILAATGLARSAFPLLDVLNSSALVESAGSRLGEMATGFQLHRQTTANLLTEQLVHRGRMSALDVLSSLPTQINESFFNTNSLIRAVGGPSTLSAILATATAGYRLAGLAETRGLSATGHPLLFSSGLENLGLDDLSRAATSSVGAFARLHAPLDLQRPVGLATLAWDQVLTGLEYRIGPREGLIALATGRATLGVINSAAELVQGEAELDEVPELKEILAREALEEPLTRQLRKLDPELPRRLEGVWERLTRTGPDDASQAAHSLMELIDGTLRGAAPAGEVMAWLRETGRSDEIKNGRPSRVQRMKYILRHRPDSRTARMYLSSITILVREIQSSKHAPSPKKVEAVVSLVPTVEGLLYFLLVSDS